MSQVLQIPPRTLARRKVAGKLTSQESEQLLRLVRLYDNALELFEGDAAATTWLEKRNKAFGNYSPLQLEADAGAACFATAWRPVVR